MHPRPLHHSDNRAMCENLIDQAGFGMVIAARPHGPHTAHKPLMLSDANNGVLGALAQGAAA